MRPTFADELEELLDGPEPVLDPGKGVSTEPLSQEAENFKAALFRVRELLETKDYAMLSLSENQLNSLALEATRPPLPEGAVRIQTIEERLKELLDAAKRDSKANSGETIEPKRGRFRPTLLYDHQRRVPPSKVVEDAVSLSDVSEGELKVDNPEDDYIAVLDRKHGSEAEESVPEPQPFEATLSEEADRVRLTLTIVKALDWTIEDCTHCGRPIPADKPRSTVLRVDHPNLEAIGVIKRIAVHCDKCRDAEATILESGPLLADLTADERQAFVLRRKGLNQREIGEAMSPPKSQETVSRILKSVEQKQSAALMATFRHTGGA